MTVTTLNADLARLLEPKAPHPMQRLNAIEKLSLAGLDVSVLTSPILPWLNDSRRHLKEVAQGISAAGVRSWSGGVLFLRDSAFRVYLPFIEEKFPNLGPKYRRMYANRAFASGEYAEMVKARLQEIRDLTGLKRGEIWLGPEETPESQLRLFPQASSGAGNGPYGWEDWVAC